MDDRRTRFEAEVLPHLDAAYRFAGWLAYAPADAEDVVQDALLRAYRSFDALRGSDAKAWLLVIVRNCSDLIEHRHLCASPPPTPRVPPGDHCSVLRYAMMSARLWGSAIWKNILVPGTSALGFVNHRSKVVSSHVKPDALRAAE